MHKLSQVSVLGRTDEHGSTEIVLIYELEKGLEVHWREVNEKFVFELNIDALFVK